MTFFRFSEHYAIISSPQRIIILAHTPADQRVEGQGLIVCRTHLEYIWVNSGPGAGEYRHHAAPGDISDVSLFGIGGIAVEQQGCGVQHFANGEVVE
jgi:hypothetical protein